MSGQHSNKRDVTIRLLSHEIDEVERLAKRMGVTFDQAISIIIEKVLDIKNMTEPF